MASEIGRTMSELRHEALAWIIGIALAVLVIGLCNAQGSGWVDQLRSARGDVCCYDNDGRRLDAVDWRRREGGFDVYLGAWLPVPESAEVKDRNHDGIARVWVEPGTTNIRCFLPGAES